MKNNYISPLHFISKHLFLLLILSSATLGMNSNAAITQVGGITTAYANTNGVQSFWINKPAGAQVGDVLILNITKYTASNTDDTHINGDNTPGWTTISSRGLSGNNSVRATIMYKIITQVDEPTTYQIVPTDNWWPRTSIAQATIVAYRGVDTSNPFDVTPGTITTPNSTSTTVSPPSITTVTPNALVTMFGMSCTDDPSITTPRTFSTWTLATSPTLSELYDSQTGNYYASVGAATGLKSTAGSTGVGTITVNNKAYLGGIILALRPMICSGRWTGDYSTDWNDTRNWCDGIIPNETTDVIIPSTATRQPTIGLLGGKCNSITINSGATLTQSGTEASNLFVYGNWTNNGAYTCGIGTTTFSGALTQTIGGSGTISFYNLTVQNTGGVTLSKATTVTRALLLISGIINTTSGLLSVTSATVNGTNNVYGVIMGGSAISYINGPVKWSMPANLATGSTYKFPVGNTTYLPYTLVNPITGGTAPTVQVQAFNANPNGSVSGTLTTLSSTEYWKLTTTGNFTNTQITLGKGDVAVYPYNVVAESSLSNGTYASLGGTPGYYEVSESTATTHRNYYFTLGTINIPTINVSPIVLGGFGYIVNFGPSSEQTFTVNGTSLHADIVIAAPTGYEISNKTGIEFGPAITLAKDGSNSVNNVTLYIRLKAGLAIGTYNGNSINITSTGATPKNIECNGTVFASTPSIITSGGLSCDGNEIDLFSSSSSPDINILYWNGPNNYYSQQQDLAITPVTASMYGLYTVTGSIPTGANLIVNGDFSQGNKGFSSSYVYTTAASNNQGIYNVTDDPRTMNALFNYPTLGDKQLVIDGATTANVTVWSETVKVVPNSTYQFTYWLKGLYNVATAPSIIQLYANNQPVGTPFTAVAPDGTDKKYYYNWYSGSSTSVTLDLRNQSTVPIGNDFALDDIDFRTVTPVSSSVNVTSNPAAAVTISTPTLNVTTKIATGTTGASTTFTATPTNGGTAPLYQWSVNGTNIGTNSSSSTFSYVPADGDVIKCVMTSNSDCQNTIPKDAISNLITMKVDGDKNYWIGTFGTDWGVPGNWTVKVPDIGDNVEFANATNNVLKGGAAKNDLYVDNNKRIGNLINEKSGKNLIIPANTQLYVNNKITLDPVDANAPYDQIQIKCDPTINNGLPNGSLIFHNKNDDPVNATVEMFTKAIKTTPVWDPLTSKYYSYQWQSLGIPIRSVQADPTFYGSYVRKYEESKDVLYGKWDQLSNGSTLLPFLGYEITQESPKIVTFTGQLVNETKPLPLTYTNGVYAAGQNILSNPYTAAIDIRKMTFDVANTEETIFLYNTGSFADWSKYNGGSTNAPINSPGQYTAIPKNTAGVGMPYDIPSMSGFLIKVTAPTSITIDYNSVITKNESAKLVKGAADNVTSSDLVSTQIDLTGQNFSDRMWIFTEPTCTPNFDNGWDGRKMLGSSLAPQIYAIEPDGDYQVNSVSDMNNTDIAFQPGNEVEYTLKFTHANLQRYYAGIFLVDLVENKTIDITESGTTYKFATAPATTPSKRFKIITRYYEKDAPDTESQLKIFSAKGSAYVQNMGTANGNCTLYSITGQAVKSLSFGPGSVTTIPNLRQGTYVLSATTNGEKVSKRVIVQ